MSWWQFLRYGCWSKPLPKGCRFVGLQKDWHDGPIWSFGFWWICWSSLGFDVAKWGREWERDHPKQG